MRYGMGPYYMGWAHTSSVMNHEIGASVGEWLPNELLGKQIRLLRVRLGLKQSEFAEALGSPKGQSEVSKWESGEVRPGQEKLQAIARLAHVPMRMFQGDNEAEEGEEGGRKGGRKSYNRAYALIAHLEAEIGTDRIALADAFGMAKDESERMAFDAEERQTVIEWMNRVVQRSAGTAIPALKVTGRSSVTGAAGVDSRGFKSEPDAATAPPPSSAELESGHEDAADAVHDAESPGPTTRKERPGRSAAGDRGA